MYRPYLFQFWINLGLLITVILITPIYYLVDNAIMRLLIIGCTYILCAVAILPAAIPTLIQELKALGKCKKLDDPKVIEIIDRLREQMGIDIKHKLKVKVRPRWANAQARDLDTVIIGQIILENADDDQLREIMAHELAHIKGKHMPKLLLPWIMVSLICIGIYMFFLAFLNKDHTQSIDHGIVLPAIVAISIALLSLGSRGMEYAADLLAAEYVDKVTMKKGLLFFAGIANNDINQDKYLHGSIEKRISNLENPRIDKFTRWYFNKCFSK